MLSRTTEIIYSDTNSYQRLDSRCYCSSYSSVFIGSVGRSMIPDLPGTPTTALGKGSKLNLQRREHCPLVLIKLTNSMGNSSSRPRWNSIETTQHNTIAIASPGVTHIVYCTPSYLTRGLFCSPNEIYAGGWWLRKKPQAKWFVCLWLCSFLCGLDRKCFSN